MVLAVALLAVVLILGYVGSMFVTGRIRLTRADRRRAPWFQIATYAEGRITHATPMRDGIHTEDEGGSCPCHPQAGVYQLPDGRHGTFYTHRSHSLGQQQPAAIKVPRRFRPGWRWPE